MFAPKKDSAPDAEAPARRHNPRSRHTSTRDTDTAHRPVGKGHTTMEPQHLTHLHDTATHIREAHTLLYLSALAVLEPYMDQQLDRMHVRGEH